MVKVLRNARIDEGQLRLFVMIADKYNVSPEDTLNRLVLEYNEMHISAALSKSMYNTSLGVSLGVVEVGEALAKKSDEEFLESLKLNRNPSVKLAKEQQVKTIMESLDD